ncbi:hypothetical protein KJ742_02505 [Patescibacteria group bacterium]|nr:hypothetical protein [Patescibacteria group bacterium]MBU1682792.1 hypothetical protein [Patescibacteria group bacterium]MBU1935395.1 hypothetical protein [Patescibacteria group bacterium]
MIENKDFPEFDDKQKETPVEEQVSSSAPISKFDSLKNKFKKLPENIQGFCEKKFGKSSLITRIINKIEFKKEGEGVLDTLTQIKKSRSTLDQINLICTIVLIVILFFAWKNGPALLAEIDQLNNDLDEQSQVIKMEEQNNEFLTKLEEDRNTLVENMYTVYAAVPDADEKAEEIIAMLEDIAAKNRMVIDAIGIREVPESQFYYDDLLYVAEPYEYTFSTESALPNILSFIGSLRSSLRLMDIMTLEIEEGDGIYKANFSVYAYHLVGDDY